MGKPSVYTTHYLGMNLITIDDPLLNKLYFNLDAYFHCVAILCVHMYIHLICSTLCVYHIDGKSGSLAV